MLNFFLTLELINEAAGVTGLIWVLVGVTAVLVVIGLCTMLNRHLKQRRCKYKSVYYRQISENRPLMPCSAGIYKTEGHLGDGSRESLTDEIGGKRANIILTSKYVLTYN